MRLNRGISGLVVLAVLAIFLFAGSASAKGGETDRVVRHLKTKYNAKKVKIPFMWLARLAVRVVKPAGVKSFRLTVFEDLKFSAETIDSEMQAVMRDSFGPKWTPILRIRSRTGEQVYMYMRDAGQNAVKLSLVTIGNDQATVIRATVNPEKLAEFMDNPKIFGVKLDDGKVSESKDDSDQEPDTQ